MQTGEMVAGRAIEKSALDEINVEKAEGGPKGQAMRQLFEAASKPYLLILNPIGAPP